MTAMASLDTLPVELQRMIIDNIHSDCTVELVDPDCAYWVPFRLSWNEGAPSLVPEGTGESIRTLRALSQTCKCLQALVLPILWKCVDLESVADLGRLHAMLRVSPHLARHIRSFCFMWNSYPKGSDIFDAGRLDLLFTNRRRLWRNFAQTHDLKIYRKGSGPRFFRFDGRKYEQPDRVSSGPDLRGEDRRIKSAQSFIKCIVEVVAQLTRLETFGWDTWVTRVPLGVFNALRRLDTLRSLRICMTSSLRGQPNLPYWLLAGNLKELSISLSNPDDRVDTEQSAASFTSFELPTEPHNLDDSDLNRAVALRTIVTAVEAGNLKRLDINFNELTPDPEDNIQSPFAVRSLLPRWVPIEKWGWQPTPGWSGAAESLRPLLAHASLWLHPAAYYNDRELTGQDVQTLCVQYKDEHIPERDPSDNYVRDERPVTRYFPWLLEDAELAQKVADAWNAVVLRGGADLVPCLCDRCNNRGSK